MAWRASRSVRDSKTPGRAPDSERDVKVEVGVLEPEFVDVERNGHPAAFYLAREADVLAALTTHEIEHGALGRLLLLGGHDVRLSCLSEVIARAEPTSGRSRPTASADPSRG